MALSAIDPSPSTNVEASASNHKTPDTAEKSAAKGHESDLDSPLRGLDDSAVLEKGSLDPVYEAKARVLNHAVSNLTSLILEVQC